MAVWKHSSLEDLSRCMHLGRELGLEDRKDSTIKERKAPCKEEALRGCYPAFKGNALRISDTGARS